MKPKLDGEHSEASQSVTERATPWVTPGEDYGSDVPISRESFEEAKRLLAAKDVDGLAAMIRVVPKRPSEPEGIPTEAKDAAAPIERRVVHDCFVLRIDRDLHARNALRAYADSCENEHPELAKDLREWVAVVRGGLGHE
jgi:hypothetical protein